MMNNMTANCEACGNTTQHTHTHGIWSCASCGHFATTAQATEHLHRIGARATYTLSDDEHAAWYSDDQRTHDDVLGALAVRLPFGAEVYDVDGIVIM